MQHAQKMALIPADKMERMQRASGENIISNNPAPSMQTPGNNLSRIDTEMFNLLNDQLGLNDRDKANLYVQLLQRFLIQKGILNNTRDYEPKPVKTALTEEMQREAQETTEMRDKNEVIVSSLPRVYQTNGRALLRYVLNSGKLDWDDKNQIIYKGQKFEETNILDLIHDTVRNRKNAPPAKGRDIFISILSELNTPHVLITNESFKSEFLSSPAIIRSTPHQRTSIKKKSAQTPTSPRKNKKDKSSKTLHSRENSPSKTPLSTFTSPRKLRSGKSWHSWNKE